MQAFKSKSLKKISAIVAATIGIAAFQPAQAAPFNASGRINSMSVVDPTQSFSALNFFTLVGVGSLGNCPAIFGAVIFVVKDDLHGQQMFATVLAAAASGSTLGVSVEDTFRSPAGFCYATSLGLTPN